MSQQLGHMVLRLQGEGVPARQDDVWREHTARVALAHVRSVDEQAAANRERIALPFSGHGMVTTSVTHAAWPSSVRLSSDTSVVPRGRLPSTRVQGSSLCHVPCAMCLRSLGSLRCLGSLGSLRSRESWSLRILGSLGVSGANCLYEAVRAKLAPEAKPEANQGPRARVSASRGVDGGLRRSAAWRRGRSPSGRCPRRWRSGRRPTRSLERSGFKISEISRRFAAGPRPVRPLLAPSP